MELAIYYCRGRELKDAIIVAYLLEYYSRNPTKCVGWLCTASKAIPLLFKYNYDDFAKKLFIRVFADQGHLLGQDPDEIIPKKYLESHNIDTRFKALTPIVKLKSDKPVKPKWYDNWIWNKYKVFKNEFKEYRNVEKPPLTLRVVPFSCFTINSIEKQKKKYNFFENILNRFLSILIPRHHQINRNERNKLSPFSRMVLYENNDDIYDNPAIEAVIDFRWQKTKYFLYFLCFRFLIFSICFILVSLSYMNRGNCDADKRQNDYCVLNGNFLLVLIIVFYYLAIYRFIIEVKQFLYRGFRKYFVDLFNFFGITSIILPVTVMTSMLYDFNPRDGFVCGENAKNAKLVVEISFSIFFIWIKFILFLRLKSDIGTYIYCVLIIFKAIIPFLRFMLVVMFAFAHAMFILIKTDSFIRDDRNINGTNINEDFNITQPFFGNIDNIFSNIYAEIKYFWIFSEEIQWSILLFILIASISLVIILQNVLIAFMNGVYVTAGTRGKQKLLRYQANYIAEYEALHCIHFSEPEPEPKHIYYFSQAKSFEEWFNTKKSEQVAIYKDFEETSIFMTSNIFKEIDYDNNSILTYNENIKMLIENYIKLGNDVNGDIEDLIDLIKRFVSKNSIEEIERIENTKIDLKFGVEKLYHILEMLKLMK
ncbi:unnamed protein product [Rhizophagus irregularis]|nr:unnamed protein product [Rhizophagus irregularis]